MNPSRPTKAPVRIAILDLYDNEPNQGMRAIREILTAHDGRFFGQRFTLDVFETRFKGEVPGLDYDVYISTGGPGSPFDGEGKPWEAAYFTWLDAVWQHNQSLRLDKKHVLFICHSFQMMVRHFAVAQVTQRRSESFGIFPIFMDAAGRRDPLLNDLPNPFYAADFRKWQVIQPDAAALDALGAQVLCREKVRPHVDLERAIMGIRLSPEFVGVQFHPEADPPGMTVHFRAAERKNTIIAKYGRLKYDRIMHRMQDEDYLSRTYRTIFPNFLRNAVAALRPEAARKAA